MKVRNSLRALKKIPGAQIVRRRHTHQGPVATPHPARPERPAETPAVFDFSLDDAEVRELSALDTGVADIDVADEFGH